MSHFRRISMEPDIAAMAYIMDVISYGLVGLSDTSSADAVPPYDALMETIAEMLDRMLTPEDHGSSEAGKVVIRQVVTAARSHFEQLKNRVESKTP